MSITFLIILITCIVSIPALNNDNTKDRLLFWPFRILKDGEYYRMISSGFIHADTMHLLFNMITFYSFGLALEQYLYPVFFSQYSRSILVVLYITAIPIASIPDLIRHGRDQGYRALGASGAVSAIIFSAILLEPTMPLRFFFIPIDIPGYIFGIGFLALSAYLAKRGQGNIGHNAHFWGGVYGLIFTYGASRLFSDVDIIGRFFEQVSR